MSTRMSCPTARYAVPIAAVVLPLPGPVLTMISPRRTAAICKTTIVLSARSFHQQCVVSRNACSNTINLLNLDDTIVALATPPGRGGIGIVRIAGPEARSIALPMLRLKQDLEPGRAIFGELVEPCGADPVVRENAGNELGNHSRAEAPAPHKQRIDEVVVTYFAKPHSYTRDDIVEISTHGSPVVLRHIVEVAMASGARLAEPGEFTMRAFLNGRI